MTCCKSSIRPYGGAYFFWGGAGKAYSIFNLEKTIASVLHTELEYKVEKF